MKAELIESNYNGIVIQFNNNAWFNATEAAQKFDKRPADWLKQEGTKEYISALARNLRSDPESLLKTRKGKGKNGTWFHPRLAVSFARWLNPDFGIWCDLQIDDIIRGKHPHHDWKKLRSEATASFKLMAEVTKMSRDIEGKTTKAHHYTNEARLVNYALTGEFKKLDREHLTASELDLVGKLEARNSVLIARGMDYKQRKIALEVFVSDWNSEAHKKTNSAQLALVK